MSFLLALDESKLSEIVPYFEKFEEHIKAAEPIFDLDGVRLETAVRMVPQYQASYSASLQDCKALEEWLIALKEKRVAKLWKKYNEHYSRTLTVRDIQAYLGGEEQIIEINQILLEVVLLKNHLNAIVESIIQLGWMVGHMTKLRVASLEESVL